MKKATSLVMKQTVKNAPVKLYLLLPIVLLIMSLFVACGNDKSKNDLSESALLRLLHFIPDTSAYREFLTYGDPAAWHSSWNIPRIDSLDELDNLDRESRAYWLFIMSSQTTMPHSLGTEFLTFEDQRGFYGFDLFNLERFIEAGQPPEQITVAEHNLDDAQIAAALTAAGYEVEDLETQGQLYSILGDYEVNLKFPMKTGSLGNLNRIALLDGQMIVAKATANVNQALLAHEGQAPSLADNANYVAAATALQDPALAETGELVGVILSDGSLFSDYAQYQGAPASVLEQLLEQYRQGPQLPRYTLVAFATRHAEGASHLILAVVFPQGTDGNAAADILADRLKNYVSLTQTPLEEHWTFEKATTVQAGELPVALVVMRVDDPPPTPSNTSQVNAAVFVWYRLVTRRDTLFLATQLPPE